MDGIITLAQARALDKALRDVISSSGEGTNSYRFPEGLMSYLEEQPCRQCGGRGHQPASSDWHDCPSCSGTGRRSPWPLMVWAEWEKDDFELDFWYDIGWRTHEVAGAGYVSVNSWLPAITVLQALEVCRDVFGGRVEVLDDPGGRGPCDSAEELLDALLGAQS